MLPGARYGRLVAIEAAPSDSRSEDFKWLFKCDCGEYKILNIYAVRKGNTSSCGCLKRERNDGPSEHPELEGQRVGHLRVLRFAGRKRGRTQRYSFWTCQCDCGRTKDIQESNLLTRQSKSCGCMSYESRKTHGRSGEPIFATLATHRNRLKKLGIEWPFSSMQESLNVLEPLYIEARKEYPRKALYLAFNPETKSDFHWTPYIVEQRQALGLPTDLATVKPRAIRLEIDGVELSLADAAKLLGVSRQRASQLFKHDHLFRRVREALKPITSLCQTTETATTPNDQGAASSRA